MIARLLVAATILVGTAYAGTDGAAAMSVPPGGGARLLEVGAPSAAVSIRELTFSEDVDDDANPS